MTTKVWAEISTDAVWLYQWVDRDDGRLVYMANGMVQVFKRHEPLPPEARVQIIKPQELLDALLEAGFRPSNQAWSAGHVAALERHIQFAERMADKLVLAAVGAG